MFSLNGRGVDFEPRSTFLAGRAGDDDRLFAAALGAGGALITPSAAGTQVEMFGGDHSAALGMRSGSPVHLPWRIKTLHYTIPLPASLWLMSSGKEGEPFSLVMPRTSDADPTGIMVTAAAMAAIRSGIDVPGIVLSRSSMRIIDSSAADEMPGVGLFVERLAGQGYDVGEEPRRTLARENGAVDVIDTTPR